MEIRSTRSAEAHRPSRIGRGRRGGDHGPGPTSAAQRPPVPRNLRQGGASEDRALYNCSCGYVFNAAVSTSVGCPHCGGTQAW